MALGVNYMVATSDVRVPGGLLPLEATPDVGTSRPRCGDKPPTLLDAHLAVHWHDDLLRDVEGDARGDHRFVGVV